MIVDRLRPLVRVVQGLPGSDVARDVAVQAVLHTPAAQVVLQQRAETLLAVIAPQVRSARGAFETVLELLPAADLSQTWLALSVMNAELPLDPQVRNLHRQTRLEGPVAIREALTTRLAIDLAAGRTPATVEILQGRVTVDVFHTANTHLATGIQRVVREAARRWDQDHELTLVSWTENHRALRLLTDPERQTALFGAVPQDHQGRTTVVVPWEGVHLIPELATEPERTTRMMPLARYSRCRSGAVGHDCVPITTSETVAEGMGGAFSLFLAAVREMDRVAAVSGASAGEWHGWTQMLGGLGASGPQVKAVPLAVNTPTTTPAAIERMRTMLGVGTDPVVLVVGSHEPRKNHLAILHAAELLWREGLQFSLGFIGGNSWSSELFQRQVSELSMAGRPVQSYSGLSDEDVWGAYHLATVTLFPSINEGYGLPVAESLSCGTPAITSAFGSMAEIAQDGGALLVDPHEDHQLTDALRRVLTDAALLADLRTAATSRPVRTWDEYAAEVWDFLVDTPAVATAQ